MSKIKIVFFLILGFVFYKGYVAFTNFEIGVSDRVTELEEKADFERQGEVIALMMYLGDPPELNEAVDKDTNKIHEAADVFYHLIIYLEANNIKIEDIEEELEKRKKPNE